MKMTKMVNSSQVERDWIVIDAEGKIFGRLVTEIATILRGKHKPCFTPHVDCGDHVVVINASKVKFTGGNKLNDKQYHRHSGYFGSVKSEKLGELVFSLSLDRLDTPARLAQEACINLHELFLDWCL